MTVGCRLASWQLNNNIYIDSYVCFRTSLMVPKTSTELSVDSWTASRDWHCKEFIHLLLHLFMILWNNFKWKIKNSCNGRRNGASWWQWLTSLSVSTHWRKPEPSRSTRNVITLPKQSIIWICECGSDHLVSSVDGPIRLSGRAHLGWRLPRESWYAWAQAATCPARAWSGKKRNNLIVNT